MGLFNKLFKEKLVGVVNVENVPEIRQIVDQTLENIRPESAIWNDYYFYFLSKYPVLPTLTQVREVAELADIMVEEYNDRYPNTKY